MTHILDLPEVIGTLQGIISTDPVGTSKCSYSVEGYERLGYDATTPLCIVGHVVYHLSGVEGLRSIPEGMALDERIGAVADALTDLGYTRDAIRLLARVQADQDRGMEWGAAVVSNIRYLTSLGEQH